MERPKSTIVNLKSAAAISAALVMFLAFGWLSLARVHAQGPTDISGQLFNGTQDAPANSIENVPVTLFQITAAGPVTRSVPTDAQGKFTFTKVLTDATSYFTRVDYAGVRYFSPIRPPELASTSPITLTVYETQTLPANFTIDRIHLILDVQSKRFNGLELVQVTNASDRAFFLPLPVPAMTSDVQFQDFREQTIVKRQADGTILYPVLPSTSDILYGVVLPFIPPDYRLQIPLTTNVSGFNLLVATTSGLSVSGSNLIQGEPFESETGQNYVVYSAPQQAAGTAFTATISNLPGLDNTPMLQNVVLAVGALGGLALLAYPIYRRRMLNAQAGVVSDRVARLQALAKLDDQYEAGELEEPDYLAQRAELKAELIQESSE